MSRRSLLVAWGIAVLLTSCQASSAEPATGRLEARWTGADSGKLKVRARATWCAPGRLLEVTGVDSDAGLGLAIYPVDTPARGTYPVFSPVRDSLRRPSVAVGVRWFTETEIKAYQSDSGTLSLTRRDGALYGNLDARLRAPTTPETIRVTGSFQGVPMTLDSTRCARDSVGTDSISTDSMPDD